MQKNWVKLETLDKSVFRATKKINPVQSLMDILSRYKDLTSAHSISDFAISEKTDDIYASSIEKYVRKKWEFLPDRKVASEVGFALLQYGPCRVADLEDMTVYIDKTKLNPKKKGKKNA